MGLAIHSQSRPFGESIGTSSVRSGLSFHIIKLCSATVQIIFQRESLFNDSNNNCDTRSDQISNSRQGCEHKTFA
jgi:hypothetical protein